MQQQQQPHRPGPLHQTNKPHKGLRQSRKSSATAEIKNKILSRSSSLSSAQGRTERLNQASQNRKLKWEKAISDKRSIGTGAQAPLNVGILGSPENFLAGLAKDESTLSVKQINSKSAYVVVSRLKMRFKLIALDYKNFDETIDHVKNLDLILLLHHPDDIEQDKEIAPLEMLQIIYIHCLPTIVHVIDGFDRDNSSMIKVKRLLKAKVGDDKMYAIESASDYLQLFHIIGSCKRQKSTFKEARPIISSDTVSLVDGRLAITGFVRNKTLSPNDLIHVVGFDDYQMHKIDILPDVVSLRPTSIEGDQVVQTLLPDPMRQETLEQENELDPMEGEQTWPTAEELADEAERKNTKRVVKRLPPGTSEYQGAWIPESDDDDASDDDDDFDEDEEDVPMGGDESSDGEAEDEQKGDDDVSLHEEDNDENKNREDDDDDAASQMDVDEYDKKYSNEREMKVLEKLREARLNEMFPDEIDTPVDQPARYRFARYRGLKSFRTSAWDAQENLPPDYSRIFQFQNFAQTKRRALGEESHEGANPGQYVRIYLANVPSDVIEKILAKDLPPSLVALLRHERKMTVMNLLIKRLPDSNMRRPIKSKDELIFYVGFRKFKARPVFTSHSISSKHKYERFLSDDVAMVATIYAPVTYPPAPVLVFRPKGGKSGGGGGKELVASGSVLDSNPNRLIIKRMRLSGHPYKIHSKTAVLRFMFFNSEDVLYFKPVELVTRYNRRGHIGEPLGTHGHMKCTFDKKIRSDDCVFMNLYKRVFPKWTYEPICE